MRRVKKRVLCWESPKQTPGFMICWDGSQDSAYSHSYGYDFSQQKDAKHNHQREKVHEAKCRKAGTSVQVSAHTRLYSKLWHHMWNTVYQEISWDTQCSVFYWGLVTWDTWLACSKIPASEKQSRNHTVCKKRFRYSEPVFSGKSGKTLQKFKFPDASQGPVLQHAFLRMC